MAELDYLFTFLWAMAPICELRCAIPLGMQSYELPWLGTLGYGRVWYGVLPAALFGNMVPAFFLILVLPKLGALLTGFANPVGHFLVWRSKKLRQVHSQRFDKYGALTLLLLVAVPLPLTGVWTASLAAWVFEIPLRRAILPIAVGASIAGAIVTTLTAMGRWFAV